MLKTDLTSSGPGKNERVLQWNGAANLLMTITWYLSNLKMLQNF